ncbi:MAG TPA: hypothetical protein VNI57_05865, partial [Candidatus Saccharimonadales bacterium]|nr:hypothetical protein [Candidatus Saccharimonadales bacterium]
QAPPPVAPAAAGDILLSGPFGESRGLLGKGRYAEAARGFQSSLAGKGGLYTVQLALACSADTVARALKSSRGAKEFFILPREFHGRACYRLVWGAYPGRAAAEKGRTSVPAAWLKDKNPPFIAPL